MDGVWQTITETYKPLVDFAWALMSLGVLSVTDGPQVIAFFEAPVPAYSSYWEDWSRCGRPQRGEPGWHEFAACVEERGRQR